MSRMLCRRRRAKERVCDLTDPGLEIACKLSEDCVVGELEGWFVGIVGKRINKVRFL